MIGMLISFYCHSFSIQIGTSPKNALKKNEDQAYILASGHDQKDIIQYYIVVEREIITVRT